MWLKYIYRKMHPDREETEIVLKALRLDFSEFHIDGVDLDTKIIFIRYVYI